MLKKKWIYHQSYLLSTNINNTYPIQNYIEYTLTIWQEQLKRNFIILLVLFRLSITQSLKKPFCKMHYKQSNTKRIWRLNYIDDKLQLFYSFFYTQIPWFSKYQQKYFIRNKQSTALIHEITYNQLTQSSLLSMTSDTINWQKDILKEALLQLRIEVFTLNFFELEFIIRSRLKLNI